LQLLFVCCVKTVQFSKFVTCTQRDGNNPIQIMKIRPVGAELIHADGQMGRETDRHDQAISRFSQNFSNMLNNDSKERICLLQPVYRQASTVSSFTTFDQSFPLKKKHH